MAISPQRWSRIKEILSAALALAPSERDRYLDGACGDDLDLRGEIDSLLASYAGAGSFLEDAAAFVPGVTGAGSAAGRTVGTYRIQSLIAAGGMGQVYLAHDAKLDRRVAIKLLPDDLAGDPARLRRFHQEARAASSLNHPHILVIHDFGELDGRPFIVTEFVEGETVRERLRRGPLAVADAVEIAIQVAGALGAAHARGIVHRDVKPDNVMLRPDGLAKVVDFGLAKLADSGRELDMARTHPGLVIGTPRYMSPEQARGFPVDARTDVWSFGVLLYEMLTGVPPFAGVTAADLVAAIVGAEPVPAALRAPALPSAVERVIARSLRKDPADRYASMGEIVAELMGARTQLAADRPAPGVVGASPSIETTPRGRTAPRTRLIVLPFRLLRPDADVDFMTFSLADSIATTLSGVDSILVRSPLAAARFVVEPLDVARLARDAEVDAVLTGTLLRAGSHLRVTAQLVSAPEGAIIWSDRVDVSLDDLIALHDELTDRIVSAVSVPLTPQDQQMLRRDVPASAKAYELYLRGNQHFYDTEQWTVARELFVACVQEDPAYAPAWARLGRCYRLTAKFRSDTVAEMRESLTRAEVAFRKSFELNPDLPLAHHLYTPLETDLGRSDEALLRLVRRVRRRRGDPALYAGLVHACRYCGLLDESVAAHLAARQLDPHAETGVVNTYWLLGDYEKALVGMTGFFVGLPLVSLGRNDEAIAAARASAAVVRDPITRSYRSILPLLLEGRIDACEKLLDDLAPRNPDPESIYLIARTYARLGALEPALQQFERAVDGGFVPVAAFATDEWLDPLRRDSRFAAALARATSRCAAARERFRETDGPRLLRQ